MKASDQADQTVVQRLGPWLLIAALILLTRPYRGLYHDAQLYMVQALNRVTEGAFANDLFFAFGNQDSFSAFTALYAPLISAFGVNSGYWIMFALGLTFWLGSLLALVCAVFDTRHDRLVAIMGALALNAAYGHGILSVGESFVTPRLFAEGLGLIALRFALLNKWAFAIAATTAAGVMHPLMGLAIAALVSWLALEKLWQWLGLVAAAVVCAMGLGWFGIGPFDWIWQQIDAQWRGVLDDFAPMVLPLQWSIYGVLLLPVKLTVLVVIVRQSPASSAEVRLAKGALVTGASLMVLAILLGDVLNNRLVISLQLWRILFLVTILANILAFAAMRHLRKGWVRGLWLLTLGLSFAEADLDMIPWASNAALILCLLTWAISSRGNQGRLLRVAIVLAAAVVGIVFFLAVVALSIADKADIWVFTVSTLCFAGIAVWIRRPDATPTVALAVIAVAGSLALFDRRLPSEISAMSNDAFPEDAAQVIKGRNVYWENGQELLWFKFQQPSFYSCRQKAGIVFFRAQAVEWSRRADHLSRLRTRDFPTRHDSECPLVSQEDPVAPEVALQRTCAELPNLDLLVLNDRWDTLYRHQWTLAAPDANGSGPAGKSYYVYDCQDFRGVAKGE